MRHELFIKILILNKCDEDLKNIKEISLAVMKNPGKQVKKKMEK